MVDVIGGGFDAGIRHGGTVPEDIVAQRISDNLRWVVAAAPSYIERFGLPECPGRSSASSLPGREELGDDRIYRWEFEGAEGEFAVSVFPQQDHRRRGAEQCWLSHWVEQD